MIALRNVMHMVEKEWRQYFASPIAYVACAIWALLFGGFYAVHFNYFLELSLRSAQQMEMGSGPKLSLNEIVIAGVLSQMSVVALFLTPMLTMRLYAEEKRQGTIELLATSPITSLQIIVGKFLGALSLYATMILASFANFLLLWIYATVKPEWKPMLTGLLALLLSGACFIAIGLFISTLTKNQIVAGTLTFGVLLGFLILGWMDDPMGGPVKKSLAYLGITNHMESMLRGVLELKDAVFYVSFIVFGLFLAHQSVESQRWRA